METLNLISLPVRRRRLPIDREVANRFFMLRISIDVCVKRPTQRQQRMNLKTHRRSMPIIFSITPVLFLNHRRNRMKSIWLFIVPIRTNCSTRRSLVVKVNRIPRWRNSQVMTNFYLFVMVHLIQVLVAKRNSSLRIDVYCNKLYVCVHRWAIFFSGNALVLLDLDLSFFSCLIIILINESCALFSSAPVEHRLFAFSWDLRLMQCSTTTSLHDLHILDNANNIVRWHRMSQCPVCLQPIPYSMYSVHLFFDATRDFSSRRKIAV